MQLDRFQKELVDRGFQRYNSRGVEDYATNEISSMGNSGYHFKKDGQFVGYGLTLANLPEHYYISPMKMFVRHDPNNYRHPYECSIILFDKWNGRWNEIIDVVLSEKEVFVLDFSNGVDISVRNLSKLVP